ncbi:glucose-6-phosphate dehydrogenase [Candidatus Binatia bacterium]|nr:glucose-6-phosphate dehydrogenase [Candidatus Binatia bacterium]
MGATGKAIRTARAADPCVMAIFGGAGDLTKRKLAPALYNLAHHGLLASQFAIVGVAMDDYDDESFRARLTEAVQSHGGVFEPDEWARLRRNCFYVRGKFDDAATYQKVAERIAAAAKASGAPGNALYYLATPPQFFGTIATHLGTASLVKPVGDAGGWSRLVVEKPFGRDLASAQALNRQLLAAFDETQIFRIDHYLGKETVQNILMFRFLNGIFEPIWNRRYVDHVQILVAETLGVEGRGAYYDTAGALRDILQNHMFQLLCLVAMEPPVSFEAEDVRNEKVKVLHAIRRLKDEEVLQQTVRGQYGSGAIEGHDVPAYRAEPSVDPTSSIDTYAAMKLYVENWRWADVPFYLRTGKRLAKHDTEIVIQFRRAPLTLLPGECGQQPNRLVIHIQPDERISLSFQAKVPGPVLQLAPVELQFSYRDLGEDTGATGYETLIYDCMIGDSTQFHRADMVEEAWKVVTPVLDVWQALQPRDFPNYPAGSWGPTAADALLERDGRQWVVAV